MKRRPVDNGRWGLRGSRLCGFGENSVAGQFSAQSGAPYWRSTSWSRLIPSLNISSWSIIADVGAKLMSG
jgi:hypothetical protein